MRWRGSTLSNSCASSAHLLARLRRLQRRCSNSASAATSSSVCTTRSRARFRVPGLSREHGAAVEGVIKQKGLHDELAGDTYIIVQTARMEAVYVRVTRPPRRPSRGERSGSHRTSALGQDRPRDSAEATAIAASTTLPPICESSVACRSHRWKMGLPRGRDRGQTNVVWAGLARYNLVAKLPTARGGCRQISSRSSKPRADASTIRLQVERPSLHLDRSKTEARPLSVTRRNDSQHRSRTHDDSNQSSTRRTHRGFLANGEARTCADADLSA